MNHPYPAQGVGPTSSLTPEEQIACIRRFYAALNADDLEGALAFVDAGFLEHAGEERRGGPAIGHKPLLQSRWYTRELLMNVEVTLRSAQAVGPNLLLVVTEIRATRRESGQFFWIQAASVVRFNAQGLLSEHWGYHVQQTGLVTWARGDAA